MSLLIVGLDTTIVNVALPAIHRSFSSSLSGLQWTIGAYTLVLASLLMLAGSTADRVGRRRVFQIGLTTFSLGSLLCALAPSLELLVAARVLQAIGGSMLNPVAMSIIRNVFDRPARARSRDRRLGRGVRDQPLAGTGGRWRAGGLDRLAIGVPGERSGRSGGDRPDGAVCPGVARPASAAHRPGRAATGDRRARDPDLRDHRRPEQRLAIGSRRWRCSRSRWPHSRPSCPTNCTATSR